ncbi:MAG: phosphoribosylaminoimidazolecarboxamide formyltransferase, 5-formaminoimidazole-4-carboxamide-1-(beta)-D-ribofuranosyl 5'-monophosphate synthetase [Candidatus Peregrinibacteria bacterium GW2011_GWF2_33_10]|nr:MAG: phosphoribosylaminoimidazolecarboxamide formyltransferase, 5-formaminoimidazole-4-carboxamide-1-(beta)-D-ribofuranosyl 5'-monophosphate synthetase [Candidatus Peregrinibacteria bacterium GW2011_GWF2_33_10]OGJ43995.1 MAG: 5-formaminoimidazole-4-carboxamide-1-(beta)-D-ribofuranosyl 5'-monophosphate synthetase [Candidatus Peregrinibacteria bacterium RIFOXYA12_FULL_33_12]
MKLVSKHSKNIKDYSICTIGSHSALQILKGAKDEGFKTICICFRDKTKPYESFKVADKIIEIDTIEEFFKVERDLMKKNVIVIPHGSFVSYLGHEKVKKIRMMHYGAKEILEYESDRNKERTWLEGAGLRMPKVFDTPENIDRPVIVKFHGAKGGLGYFVAKSPDEFYEKMKKFPEHEEDKDYAIQEYILGVPIYIHYFYSKLNNELEIMSCDKRYESNADSIGRIAAKDQLTADINASYTIIGNIPIVIRESLLPDLFKMGEDVVKESKKYVKGGLFGPFCLETIIKKDLRIFCFEISARIVAGTNPYTNGSPYTWLRYNESMSTGRRIARDIKEAIEKGKLEKVLG